MRVLLVQPNLHHPGGGSSVAAWMLEALRATHDVTVLATAPADVDDLNHLYGTSLRAGEFALRRPPLPMRIASRAEPHPFGAQRTAWIIRAAKQLAPHHDVLLTAHNELDLGRRAIQYVHYPVFHEVYERLQAMRRPPWQHALWTRLTYRYRPWWLISGYDFDRMRTNRTLVCSDWIGAWMHRAYGIPTTTLYPPVAGTFPVVSWEERARGFLCVGRIVAEKRLLEIIDIVAALRAGAPDVTLTLVGVPGTRPGDTSYYDAVRQRAGREAAWVTLHENLPRHALLQLMAQHRFGLHGMADEHYGMAIAEMVAAGCIVFVPNDGGQVEIVGRERRLCYDSTADAIAKIEPVLHDPSVQVELRERLRSTARWHSAEEFVARVQAIVDEFGRA